MNEVIFVSIMNKADYIDYWKQTAQKDWDAVGHLFDKGDFVHALFFSHLVLEKLLKAHHVKDNEGNHPPRTHNLLVLVSQTNLKPDEEQMIMLSQMNQFNLESRYPDYKMTVYQIANRDYTQGLLYAVQTLKEWLTNNL